MSILKDRLPSVAVIGAGPAGCAAAFALKKAGIDVFIFERGRPGKDKPCGDAYIPSAVELLSEFGIYPEGIASLGAYPFQRIDLYGSSAWLGQAPMGGNNGWVVRRALLDQKLRDIVAMFAQIHYETLVTDLEAEPDGTFRLILRLKDGAISEFYCDAVILATGTSNLFSQRWGMDGQPTSVAAITTYAAIKEPEAPIFQFKEECRPGYGWVFPLTQGRVNIGVCAMAPDNIKRLRRIASAYVAEWGVPAPFSWRGGGGQLWSNRSRVWHHPAGIVSCGDAAGLVDPHSGEGITAALASGKNAGLSVSRYLKEQRQPARLVEYSQWVLDYFSQVYRTTQFRSIWASLCGM